MDRTTILTILLTVVSTVVAEALLRWLLDVYRSARSVRVAGEFLRKVFSKPHRAILVDAFFIALYIGLLVSLMTADGPPARWEIGLMIFAVLTIIFLAISILFRVSLAMARREAERLRDKPKS